MRFGGSCVAFSMYVLSTTWETPVETSKIYGGGRPPILMSGSPGVWTCS